jgi:pyruvate,water dikinase
MKSGEKNWRRIIDDLNERAKELNCLYQVEEILKDGEAEEQAVINRLIAAVPPGWQYADICRVRIEYLGKTYTSADFRATSWSQSSTITVDDQEVGRIEVCYLERGSFLPEEQKLLDTIADRLSHFLFQKRLRQTVKEWNSVRKGLEAKGGKRWEIIIELLEKTDRRLFDRIARKMLNYLCWIGIEEARRLLQDYSQKRSANGFQDVPLLEANRPAEKADISDDRGLLRLIFDVAQRYLSDEEIFEQIQKWVRENRLGFLVQTLENLNTSLSDIFEALSRYHQLEKEEIEISPYARKNINILLIQRLLTEHMEMVNIAKDYVDIHDFYEIMRRTIFPRNSHGKLGGKSTGLFIASQIIRKFAEANPELQKIRIPKTWYITSDGLQCFLAYNDLEEMLEQKFKSVEQIREEYPNIVQIYKNSSLPSEMTNWLSACLDDFGERPIIVRSSGLLEDRVGMAFSGKYKSLFLANQGSKQERLEALTDAIAEVYASVFGPDPIEYRKERGLITFHEEMGILIQEVVGSRIGQYFLPDFAGLAFSNNEFRWSPRIRREDGLLRLVPGLGTRAVDRLSDDYPKLIALGQPALSVNATVDEILHYSPRDIDVIDLEHNSFTTISLKKLLQESGESYPGVEHMVSEYRDNRLNSKSLPQLDFQTDDLVATFDGVISRTSFVREIKAVLDLLREKLGTPVDIEFAVCRGEIYLLQCRPQSSAAQDRPSPLPKNVPPEALVFSANKYISNGQVPDITHVIYVDPEKYTGLETIEELKRVGRAIGRLNALLPKRQFILMGPGRWGSRGDIRLGVPVTYSEINNSAVLIEIARKKGKYVPDLSFGTHFFQDLVESSIRYLPLYPDEPGNILNEEFLTQGDNILAQLAPEHAQEAEVVRVIDVPRRTEGKVLRVAMNADQDAALAFLAEPGPAAGKEESFKPLPVERPGEHWRWRMRMAENIAARLDARRFGVKALYVIGSTKNATATAASDIDLLVHFQGSGEQRRELEAWLEGWSLSLAEVNYIRSGYRVEKLLDVHIVSDEDIARQSSFAVKIGAVTDSAQPLVLR